MFVATTDSYPGYWGSGDDEREAVANCKKHGGRAPFISWEIDDFYHSARVDGLGQIFAEAKSTEKPRSDWPPVVASVTRIGVRGKRTVLG